MPVGVVEDAPQDFESMPLDQKFRAECIEFVVMTKPLPRDGANDDNEWEVPEASFFDNIMNEVFAEFIDTDITRMDAIKWSSVGTQTGVGAFSAVTNQLDKVQHFRSLMRAKVFNGQRAESFPKQTLLNNYGITLYAHGATTAYRAPILLAMLLRTHQEDFKGQCEVLKHDKFPANHPIVRKQKGQNYFTLTRSRLSRSPPEIPSQLPFQCWVLPAPLHSWRCKSRRQRSECKESAHKKTQVRSGSYKQIITRQSRRNPQERRG